MNASPFAQAAPDLRDRGFTVLPIIPPSVDHHKGRGKAPGHMTPSGDWSGLPRWQTLLQSPPSDFQFGLWLRMADAGVGVVCGTSAGRSPEGEPLFVLGIDIDCDGDDLDAIVRTIPSTPMAKVGRIGRTQWYRAPASITSRSFDRAASADAKARRLVDLLAANRQSVMPPSLHAQTGQAYHWIGEPVAADQLPIFTDDNLTELEEVLETLGWERGGRSAPAHAGPRVERVRGQYNDEWAETNGEALARAAEWFPALDLPKTRQSRAGIWSAVPIWRESCSGRPTEMRKPNLSISTGLGGAPAGIRDFGASGAEASLTAIDVVQRALELSAAEAKDWLRERLGLDDDSVMVDVAAMVASHDEQNLPAPLRGLGAAPEKSAPPATAGMDVTEGGEVLGGKGTVAKPVGDATHDVSVELPEPLCRVPGLVGDIADWITATARKPQPSLSLAMAIGIVGTVAGRKFCGPTKSACHLYLLCTGPTGSGKGAPKKAGAQLLNAAGLRGLVGPSSFTSASALIQHVAQNPASLCVMDEFSMLIGKLNAKNNSSHERAISGEMRQFWSLSFEEYVPPRWAAGRDRVQPQPIISPALSLIGLTTADELYSVLQGADVVSGFLNRFLLVATLNNPLDVEPSADVFAPPQALVDGLQAIANVGGPIAQATMHAWMPDRPLVSVAWEDGPGGAAHRTFLALVSTVAGMTEHEALTQRCAEMAVRLATIRAIGIGGPEARVTVDDMQWGADFALWSTRRLIADVAAHMVQSDHQGRAKFVLRLIRAAPEGFITRTKLCQGVDHLFDARTLDTVLAGLIETDQIRVKESDRKGPGRKAAGYFAT